MVIKSISYLTTWVRSVNRRLFGQAMHEFARRPLAAGPSHGSTVNAAREGDSVSMFCTVVVDPSRGGRARLRVDQAADADRDEPKSVRTQPLGTGCRERIVDVRTVFSGRGSLFLHPRRRWAARRISVRSRRRTAGPPDEVEVDGIRGRPDVAFASKHRVHQVHLDRERDFEAEEFEQKGQARSGPMTPPPGTFCLTWQYYPPS
jgi:hypothetical protein